MKNNWAACENMLVIRPDNMGDLLMSGPAIRALKESYDTRITVLTSSMAAAVANLMTEIDEVISVDFPWVKNDSAADDTVYIDLIARLRSKNFDGAVIFTVYSQNPMPSIMLAYLAGIPNRLAYCRENPYRLLTTWVPDEEPYTYIRHQVRRDLELVAQIGAATADEKLRISTENSLWNPVKTKLIGQGFDPGKKWIIIHTGVSEKKRQFPIHEWVKTARKLIDENGFQIVLTGSEAEKLLTAQLRHQIGSNAVATGGLFNISELAILISKATAVLSVNTGIVHIAAAVGTPVVVLYALTNPQHTPWMVPNWVLPYQVADGLHSKNEVVKYVNSFFNDTMIEAPEPGNIAAAMIKLLEAPANYLNNELCLIELMEKRVSLA